MEQKIITTALDKAELAIRELINSPEKYETLVGVKPHRTVAQSNRLVEATMRVLGKAVKHVNGAGEMEFPDRDACVGGVTQVARETFRYLADTRNGSMFAMDILPETKTMLKLVADGGLASVVDSSKASMEAHDALQGAGMSVLKTDVAVLQLQVDALRGINAARDEEIKGLQRSQLVRRLIFGDPKNPGRNTGHGGGEGRS